MIIFLIIILFFLAILLGLITFYLSYNAMRSSPSYELRKRLRNLTLRSRERLPEDAAFEILQEMSRLDKFLYKFRLIQRLDAAIDRAGLKTDVKVFMLIVVICILIAFGIGLVLNKGFIVASLFIPIGAIAPFIYLKVKRDKRVELFTEGFPQALEMMSRSLKAGHSLSAAVQMIGNEMSEPISSLFKQAYEEQTFGLTLNEAMVRMMDRIETMDLRLYVSSLVIYRDIGGNLSEMLEKLAHTIRERLKIKRQIRVYTAQARLTGYILAALPIAMAFILSIIATDYIKELISIKVGKIMIAAAVVGQIIGFLIIRKLIALKF